MDSKIIHLFLHLIHRHKLHESEDTSKGREFSSEYIPKTVRLTGLVLFRDSLLLPGRQHHFEC